MKNAVLEFAPELLAPDSSFVHKQFLRFFQSKYDTIKFVLFFFLLFQDVTKILRISVSNKEKVQ